MTFQADTGKTGDAEHVAATLTTAFMDNPFAVWAVPPPVERQEVLRAFFALYVADCLTRGEVHMLGEPGHSVAATLWYDRRKHLDHGPEGFPDAINDACGKWAPRFQLIDDAFTAAYPRQPHFYLAFAGVRPASQGRGLGGSLMKLAHEAHWIDDDLDGGTPSYLEATSDTARRLYERAGYQTLSMYTLPDGGPPWWAMWHPPR